jgi:hypothetical protein
MVNMLSGGFVPAATEESMSSIERRACNYLWDLGLWKVQGCHSTTESKNESTCIFASDANVARDGVAAKS